MRNFLFAAATALAIFAGVCAQATAESAPPAVAIEPVTGKGNAVASARLSVPFSALSVRPKASVPARIDILAVDPRQPDFRGRLIDTRMVTLAVKGDRLEGIADLSAPERYRAGGEGIWMKATLSGADKLTGEARIEGQENVSEEILVNPGPSYKAGMTLSVVSAGPMPAPYSGPRKRRLGCGPGTTLEEADLTGSLPGKCSAGLVCGDVFVPPVKNGACFSYLVDTRVGWESANYRKEPGWSYDYLSGGNGTPLEQHYVNHAHDTDSGCELREVGLIYAFDGDSSKTAFRAHPDGSRIKMGDYKKVVLRFKAKVDTKTYRPSRCPLMPTAYLTADFRVGYSGATLGKPITAYWSLNGSIFFGSKGRNAYGIPVGDAKFWVDSATNRRLLIGSQLNKLDPELPPLPEATDSYQTYEIDLTRLLLAADKPTVGLTPGDAVIQGLDIYSSVRGGDLDFTLTDVQLIGSK